MSNDDTKSGKDYEVGYAKPPQYHRFKPGQSGNPKGRSKGTRNFKADLAEESAEMVTITEGGRKKRISKQRLAIKALMAKACKGDPRAIALVLQVKEKHEVAESLDATMAPLAEADEEILHLYSARPTVPPKDNQS
jgi:Family of unknown function (DUF5681)